MTGKRRVPEWLFGLNVVPFGVYGAFIASVLPFILRQKGVDVGRIAEISALTLLPSTFQFLWAPLVDFGIRRKFWLLLLVILGSVCTFIALNLPLPDRIDLFVPLLVLGQGLIGLTTSCNGGLIAMVVPVERMGRASSWLNIGNLVAGALAAYVLLLVVGHVGQLGLSLIMVAMLALPAFGVLAVPEPKGSRRKPAQIFGDMFRDVWSTIKSRSGWTGIIICFSPAATAVASGLFSGIAVDYHAPEGMVTYVNGLGNALLTALGCYIGGRICDVMDRRLAYALAGGLIAICAFGMMLAPMTPMTYAVGASVYLLITGFCYAAFYAFVLEIVGAQQGGAASTRYTLFTAAANGALLYVTRLDGMGYDYFKSSTGWWNGPRGLLAVDAAVNLIGIIILLTLVTIFRPGRASNAESEIVAVAR